MSEQRGEEKRSIRQINALIREIVEHETVGYPYWVSGIVQNYHPSNRGYEFFDLQDDDHLIRCIIRENVSGKPKITLRNGNKIEVFGSVHIWQQQVRAQIVVEKVQILDNTSLSNDTVFEELKKLGQWPRVKRPLPKAITTIGLITSDYGAAKGDFETTYKSGGGLASIKPIDVVMQGPQATTEIADAVKNFSESGNVDVIVIIRGGGPNTELAVFNNLEVAEAICKSNVPVVTGIGHSQDITVADEVADVQEITPTAAAIRLARQSPLVSTQPRPTSWVTYVSIAIAVLAVVGLVVMVITRQ